MPANYSIPNVPRLNLTGARQYLAGLTPLQTGYFEQNPQEAYQTYINNLSPSLSNENYLQTLYQALRSDWFSRVSDQAQQGVDYKWSDYLQDFNPQRRMSQAAPQTRYENPQRFQQRARVIAF